MYVRWKRRLGSPKRHAALPIIYRLGCLRLEEEGCSGRREAVQHVLLYLGQLVLT